MITKDLVLKLFEAFSIQRWTDFIRPVDLVEIDQTAEKMFLAYIIGKYEEKDGKKIDWNNMIDSQVYDLFRRIALSDIKSPVQRMIRKQYPEEFKKLNEWVFGQYEDIIDDENIMTGFRNYLFTEPDTSDITWRVMRAAHKYATIREFEILKLVNEPLRLGDIEKNLQDDIKNFMDLRGIQLLFTRQEPYKLLIEIERLRFQSRWNQTPRIPVTSVLGHSGFVAILTLLISKRLNLPKYRQCNNFFAGLFHDLPEAVTRDIISPVKQATNSLPDILKWIEELVVKETLLPLMDDCYRHEVEYFIQSEFKNKCQVDGKLKIIENNNDNKKYSYKKFKPVDGRLVRLADHIAAFVEADRSIAHGITSSHLQEGRDNLLIIYRDLVINGFDVEEFFAPFRHEKK